MAQNIDTTTDLEFLKISSVTNKNCHMCPEEFLSVHELHEHIGKMLALKKYDYFTL